MNIIAHRGYSSCFPENTLAAITAAWKTPAQGVEIDVRLTRDGEIVVIHDSHTGRVTSKKLDIEKTTCARLRTLDFGMGEKIPLLTEVLQTVPKGKVLYIEPKCNAVLEPLVSCIQKSTVPKEQLQFIGFESNVSMQRLKAAFPGFPVHCLIELTSPEDLNAERFVAAARSWGIDGIQCGHSNGRYLEVIDKKFVRTLQKAGVALHVWTVNYHGMAQQLKHAGVSGVTTDRPELIARCIG